MSEFTKILHELDANDPHAAEKLLPLVYDELRTLAAAHLANEKPGQTLQATALVHEAYVRLVGGEGKDAAVSWKSRGHFFGAAAVAIRRILIDNARKKHSLKRGGDFVRQDVAEVPALPETHEDLLALDDALRKLATIRPDAAELVQLLYFAGLTLPAAAGALGVSPRTAGRLWAYARAWLRREMEGGD